MPLSDEQCGRVLRDGQVRGQHPARGAEFTARRECAAGAAAAVAAPGPAAHARGLCPGGAARPNHLLPTPDHRRPVSAARRSKYTPNHAPLQTISGTRVRAPLLAERNATAGLSVCEQRRDSYLSHVLWIKKSRWTSAQTLYFCRFLLVFLCLLECL